jgi:NADH-quinone oxidoreductase subunit F
MSKNLRALSARKGLDANLFAEIGRLAEPDGSLTDAQVQELAERYQVGTANIYGAASFYDFTRPANRGKRAYVCNGTACLLAGTQPAVHQALADQLAADEIGEMCCLGRCHENAAFQLDGHNYSGNAAQRLPQLVAQPGPAADTYAVQAHGPALLTSRFPVLNAVGATLARMLTAPPEAVVQEVIAARIRGRGGAGFPLGLKLEACRAAPGPEKYVVCNADEGDPGSYSDRYLLEQRPEAVLLGLLIAGYAIGAQTGILYIRAEYPEAIDTVERAIAALAAAKLAGKAILDTPFDFHFKIIKARGAYVCGEETALLASIEGQRPEVQLRPPFPTEEGLFGRPTLVNNVETLANLYPILKHGGAAFAALGTPESTGTKLLSVDGSFRRPGLYEVPMGTPLPVVIDQLAGGFRRPVKAIQVGGPLGGIVPVHKIPDLTVDFESFRNNGFLLGHASIVGIPEDYPMVALLEHLFDFTAHESCGKCFPCRLGSVRGRELLQAAQNEEARIDRALFDDLLDTLEQGSLCALGGGMPLPVRNALTYFAAELQPFFK